MTDDEEIVTTWGFVIHGEVVPVTVTDVYAMLGHEPREFYSAEVTYDGETYRVDARAWTDGNEPMGPVMWLARDLIERRVPVTEVLMPGQAPRAALEAERDALRAELVKVTGDARTTFLCNEIARIACERAVNHNERAIRAAEVLAAEVAALRAKSVEDRAIIEDLSRGVMEATRERHAVEAALAGTEPSPDSGLAWRVWALRALLDGSEVAPTDEEIEAHAKSGGRWRCVVPDNLRMCADAMHAHAVRLHRATLDALGLASRWWALDADGRPCPRPVPPSKL